MKMKRKQIKDNKKDKSKSEYTKEEITSAITLVSIMANEDQGSDGSTSQVHKGLISSAEADSLPNESRRSSSESSTQTPFYGLPPKQMPTTVHSFIPMSVPNGGSYPLGSVNGCYPMESAFGYSNYFPMYSMQTNFGPTAPTPQMIPNFGPMIQTPNNMGTPPMMAATDGMLQCPYCMAPNAQMPVPSTYVNAFQMAEKFSKTSEPIVFHSVTVPQNQWIQSQNTNVVSIGKGEESVDDKQDSHSLKATDCQKNHNSCETIA